MLHKRETEENREHGYINILLPHPLRILVCILFLFAPFHPQSFIRFNFVFERAPDIFTCAITNLLALVIERGHIFSRKYNVPPIKKRGGLPYQTRILISATN